MDALECKYCNTEKGLEEFYVRSDTGKHTTECRACRSERSRGYYRNNRVRHAATVKRRYDEFGRFDRYGLTPEKYDTMLARQGGACALCRTTEPRGKGKWHVDHQHETGKTYHTFKQQDGPVRGLLCHRCNQALGFHENLLQRVGAERLARYIAMEPLDDQ